MFRYEQPYVAICMVITYLKFCTQFFSALYVCLLQVFDLYGVGLRQACASPNLQKELNLKVITMQKNAWTYLNMSPLKLNYFQIT